MKNLQFKMYKQDFQHDWNGLGCQYTQLKLSNC